MKAEAIELDPAVAPPGSGQASASIRRSILFMQQHLRAKVKLEDMADIACMSPYHFLRVFRKVTGVPPARFLSALRLEAAKDLLLSGDMAVLDICYEVGYSSLGTFTSRFSQLVGVAPAHYRELYRVLSGGHMAGARLFSLPPMEHPAPPIEGTVDHQLDADVVVFVGLFATAIPQDLPLSCHVLTSARAFRLNRVESPSPLYVLSIALRRQDDLLGMFDNRRVVCALGSSGALSPEAMRKPITLTLRAREIFDPPILLAFPLLTFLKMTSPRIGTLPAEALTG